jgi:hypothetical protein
LCPKYDLLLSWSFWKRKIENLQGKTLLRIFVVAVIFYGSTLFVISQNFNFREKLVQIFSKGRLV